ncbi:MAG: Chorismate synthase AroC [Candidatus Methanohalarchaeum thermophilum]|uniref:Chorismate synthase n=1 Tax=Methanohalarchaeum thermophilum TaxID=1903181 RepID=A0A1Q6DVW4_METT1|nr:MAG: Chorismate synthase AroC [Candidatus Methanohalarchaeum thermophilum]
MELVVFGLLVVEMSNTFGKLFRLTTFGESHGDAVGGIVDGCPAGLELTRNDIQKELDKRKPGQSDLTTSRKEGDRVRILSGVFEGRTIGTPIAMVVQNEDVDSSKYSRDLIRPGHADYMYERKYGFRDYRGGGRSSGRETVGRVCGGAIAKKLLERIDVEVFGHVTKVGGIECSPSIEEIKKHSTENKVRCGDPDKAEKMAERIKSLGDSGDSIGGCVEVIVENLPLGVGEPVFDKLEAELAKATLSVGAVKGFEIGAGFKSADKTGSQMNDPFRIHEGKIDIKENDAGGVLGGISSGEPINIRASVKPTPSISKPQKTVNLREKEEKEIQIRGRHDPCICPRIVPVLESMVSLTIVDLCMRSGNLPVDKINDER